MKKIVALLAMATLFTTVMAQDVSLGGWFSTEGRMNTQGGGAKDQLSDDDKKSTYEFGATELSYTINAVGENFGATGTLDGWFSGQAHGGYAATNARIWSKFHEMFTLHAGYQMKNLSYAPGSMIEGGKIFNDQFGLGMGKYNYAGDSWTDVAGVPALRYTQPVTGVIGQVQVAGLDAAVVFRAPVVNGLQEDEVKNNMVFNAKYDAGMVVAYAGMALQAGQMLDLDGDEETPATYEEYANNGLWLAASINALEGLTSDVKFETNLAEDAENQFNIISLNLGYDLGVVAIGTETNIALSHEDNPIVTDQTLGWVFGMRVTPANVPVVGVSVDAEFRGNDVEDSVVAYAFGLNVNKVIGNVNNQLAFVYDGDKDNSCMEDPVSNTMVNYKITMWF